MKRFALSLAALAIAVMLAACVSEPGNPGSPTSAVKTSDTTQPQPTVSQTAPESPAPAVKEKNKNIEVVVEGSKEMRPAVLTQSEQSGYEFYLLENYGFSAEEPGKDVIYSKYDDSFFVRIEKLDKSVDLEKYKTQQMEAYKKLGQVTEMKPSELFSKSFQDASFCFITETKDSGGLKTSILYVAKVFDGEKFAFTFFMPLKEAAEGITPSFWAMLGTLESIK